MVLSYDSEYARCSICSFNSIVPGHILHILANHFFRKTLLAIHSCKVIAYCKLARSSDTEVNDRRSIHHISPDELKLLAVRCSDSI